jgi:hypothetical protein
MPKRSERRIKVIDVSLISPLKKNQEYYQRTINGERERERVYQYFGVGEWE